MQSTTIAFNKEALLWAIFNFSVLGSGARIAFKTRLREISGSPMRSSGPAQPSHPGAGHRVQTCGLFVV